MKTNCDLEGDLPEKNTHPNRKIDETVMDFRLMYPFSAEISLHLQYVLDSKCPCHFMASLKRASKSKIVFFFIHPHAHSGKGLINNL